jgi:hypothetical protein
MNQRGEDRVENPESGEPDSDRIYGNRPKEVSHDDPMALTGDLQQLSQTGEIVAE